MKKLILTPVLAFFFSNAIQASSFSNEDTSSDDNHSLLRPLTENNQEKDGKAIKKVGNLPAYRNLEKSTKMFPLHNNPFISTQILPHMKLLLSRQLLTPMQPLPSMQLLTPMQPLTPIENKQKGIVCTISCVYQWTGFDADGKPVYKVSEELTFT